MSKFLQEDGTSFINLEDASGVLLIEDAVAPLITHFMRPSTFYWSLLICAGGLLWV